MNFNKHLNLEGLHAFLGASKYHWINYDEDKLITSFSKYKAAQKGTELHEWASQTIRLGRKQPKTKNTLNSYINDAIGFKMDTEQPLYYSENCFGTTDAISFRKNFLRIHDLKNGSSPASIKQLLIYAALFCLEYKVNPNDINMELRIYQSDEIFIRNSESDPSLAEEIFEIMDKIIIFDKRIEKLKTGE